jgi:hypothetical protein
MNKFFMGLGLTAALAACGGGGDDAPGFTPATATFPMASAYKAYMSGPNVYNYGISGTCGGSASETTSPPVNTTFQGGPVLVKTSTLEMAWGNCASVSGIRPGTDTLVGQTFFDSNMQPLAQSVPAEGFTVVFTSGAAIPATVKVGDSAIVASGAGVSVSYAVEAETETSVIVKLTTITVTTTTTNDKTTVSQTTETLSYRLTAAGALTLLRDEILMPNNVIFILTPK